MRSIHLGQDLKTGADIHLPIEALRTHLHLIGGTGKGKTTAIHTMLQPLLSNPFQKASFIIIDRLGNFSQELLLWMSSRFCPDHVRERLVYIQGAREDIVPTFNPLAYGSDAECFYRVERTTEIVLRAWESQDISQMPRLARWTFNAFMAAARLGLTVSDCNHFVMPGSKYHQPLLAMLPERLREEWYEITSSRGQDAIRTLDSSRNRLKPYFDNDILRRMFGSTDSRLDVLKMMRDGRIVIIDLAPRNRLSTQSANTIGALLINEVLAVARSLPRGMHHPTYLFLDEFQNFVGPDLEAAIPEVRQLGLRLILSHQSLSQLMRGEQDLTNMIFQAQSRMIFGVQGLDADVLAQEVASITFDSRRIKEEIYSRRQLNKGQRKEILSSWGSAEAQAEQWAKTYSQSRGDSEAESRRLYSSSDPTKSETQSRTRAEGGSDGKSRTTTSNHGQSETLVPVYEDFVELASRSYTTFEEQKSEWARDIRNLPTGHALLRAVNDPRLHMIKVRRSMPGFLGYDQETLQLRYPEVFDRMDQMIEQNFRSEYFVAAEAVDREAESRLERILRNPVVIESHVVPENTPFDT